MSKYKVETLYAGKVVSTNTALSLSVSSEAVSRNYNQRQNELRHLVQNLAFLRFTDFKRRKYSFSSPIRSMQCCTAAQATFRKQQTPQLWMEGTGEGCGFFCSDSCFVLLEYNVSTILSPIVGGWCINFGAIMFPGYYRQTIFFFRAVLENVPKTKTVCSVWFSRVAH